MEHDTVGEERGAALAYHVTACESGWQVVRQDTPLATYPTRDQAVDVGRELARQIGGPVIVHSADSN